MNTRRRGVLLVEMLTVLLMIGIGGTILAVAFGSMLKSQRRVVEFGNRYAATEDLLRCFARDVRRAAGVTVEVGGTDGVRQILYIGKPPEQIVYRFYVQKVCRSVGTVGTSASEKLWDSLTANVSIVPEDQPHGTAVRLTVFWRHAKRTDPEPDRRFDMVVRAAQETSHGND